MSFWMLPSQVYGVEWNPHELTHGSRSQFVTFGRKHIKVWSSQDGKWTGTQMSMGRLPLQNITAAAWLPPRAGQTECMIAAGVADGQIYLLKVRLGADWGPHGGKHWHQ